MVRQSRALLLGILVLTSAAASLSGFDETRDDWIRGVYTGNTPRAQLLPLTDAWHQATEIARLTPGAFILVGTGRSMQPLYPEGTILVLREAGYGELRRGQTVVYRNRNHRAVGHVLVAKARDGWRVRGLNNRTHDPEPVVADNLIGVIVAAFQPEPGDRSQVATARRPAGRAVFLAEQDR